MGKKVRLKLNFTQVRGLRKAAPLFSDKAPGLREKLDEKIEDYFQDIVSKPPSSDDFETEEEHGRACVKSLKDLHENLKGGEIEVAISTDNYSGIKDALDKLETGVKPLSETVLQGLRKIVKNLRQARQGGQTG